MKKLIPTLLLLTILFSLFLLTGCGTTSKLMDKPNQIDSIVITKKSTGEQITLNESQIQQVAQSMSEQTVKKRSFQEIWNSMGRDTSYEYHYKITVVTKARLFSSSKEYSIFLGKTDDDGREYTFVRRDDKFGAVSGHIADYIRDLF